MNRLREGGKFISNIMGISRKSLGIRSDNPALVFLDSTTKTLKKTLVAIDEILKKRNIDVRVGYLRSKEEASKLYNKISTKGKDAIDKGKELWNFKNPESGELSDSSVTDKMRNFGLNLKDEVGKVDYKKLGTDTLNKLGSKVPLVGGILSKIPDGGILGTAKGILNGTNKDNVTTEQQQLGFDFGDEAPLTSEVPTNSPDKGILETLKGILSGVNKGKVTTEQQQQLGFDFGDETPLTSEVPTANKGNDRDSSQNEARAMKDNPVSILSRIADLLTSNNKIHETQLEVNEAQMELALNTETNSDDKTKKGRIRGIVSRLGKTNKYFRSLDKALSSKIISSPLSLIKKFKSGSPKKEGEVGEDEDSPKRGGIRGLLSKVYNTNKRFRKLDRKLAGMVLKPAGKLAGAVLKAPIGAAKLPFKLADRLLPGYEGRQDRRKLRAEEVEKEKEALKERNEGKGKKKLPSWLTSLFTKFGPLLLGIGTAIKGFTKGLLKGMGRAAWWLGGKVLGGLGKLGGIVTNGLGALGKKIITSLGKGLGGLIKKIPGVGKVGSFLGKTAGKVGGFLGKTAGKFLGGGKLKALASGVAKLGIKRAAMTALGVITGPVGMAVMGAVTVGMAAYAGYKLYKKYTDKDKELSTDPATANKETIAEFITTARLVSYGIREVDKVKFPIVLETEELFLPIMKYNDTNKTVTIGEITPEMEEKLLKLYEISDEDEKGQEKLNRWLTLRFCPNFGAFLASLWEVKRGLHPANLEALTYPELSILNERFKPRFSNEINYIRPPGFQGLNKNNRARTDERVFRVYKANIHNKLTSLIGSGSEDKLKEVDIPVKSKGTTEDNKTSPDGVDAKSILEKAKTNKGLFGSVGSSYNQEAEEKPNSGGGSSQPSAPNSKLAPGPVRPGDPNLTGISFGRGVDADHVHNLNPEVFKLFTGMAKEYNEITGKNISVNEAFRSRAQQEALYRKYGEGRAAKPGTSLHEYGLAVDINTVDVKALDSLGLLRKYGFTAPVGGETWHLEPAGIATSPQEAKGNANLANRLIAESIGRGGLGYAYTSGNVKYSRNIGLQKEIFGGKPVSGLELLTSTNQDDFIPTTLANAKGINEYTSAVTYDSLEQLRNNIPSSDTNVSNNQNTQPLTPPSMNQEAEEKPKESSSDSVTIDGRFENGKYNPAVELGGTDMSPETAIQQASKMTGVDHDTLLTFAKLESSLNPNAKAKTTSASGLYQHLDDTWEMVVKATGKKYGLTMSNADRFNPLHSALMGAELLKRNDSYISGHQQAGIPKNVAYYLAHFLGPGGARKFINVYTRNPNSPMSAAVSSASIKANRGIMQGKSVGQFLQAIISKWNNAGGTSATSYGTSSPSSSSSTPSSDSSVTKTAEITKNMNYDPFGSPGSPSTPSTGNTPTLSTSTINASAENYNTNTMPQEQQAPVISTRLIEESLTTQTSLMTRMVDLLDSINTNFNNPTDSSNIKGKVDTESRTSQERNVSNTNRQPQSSRTIPRSAVDLSRKEYI